ncbi:hypothetical protein CTEN210_16179 [Chaetoceros tenuissimus]|uniref:MYND-type domain-containing protein n=1 Tax=Chaetoceros tenuissimus TaxID=426638 RepID=A0AAD3HE62_9STRA|nr:hypothetical protein CTEN210_16179 [Chaetoceros tenuissimus]
MAKKKPLRANRKKNRKGAAGKQASRSDSISGDERVSAGFRPFQIDESMSLLGQKALQNANHHIQNQSLGSKEQKRLLKKMDTIYNKDLRKWVVTLHAMMNTGAIFSLGSRLSAVFDQLVVLMKDTISATKKKDVLVDGMHLHMTVNIMCLLMHVMNSDEEEILDLLESLTNTAKTVSDTHYSNSGAAYVLCHFMMYCSTLFSEKKRDDPKPLMMIARSGILEQVLLHIHLSWSPLVDEQTIIDGYNGFLQNFFGLLNSYPGVIHKIFKEGTACHNALNAIVQDHSRPCRANMHMLDLLQSIKKMSDLSTCSKQLDMNETFIDMARHSCAKCKTIDLESPLLVCAKCKGVGYCSKECQVADWKNHKVDCLKKLSDMTASKRGDAEDLRRPVFNLTKQMCAKCNKVHVGKQLLVCAKCKYIGYCSKQCQVPDWKNHKEQCEIHRKTKYNNIDEIIQNFYLEHRSLIDEKVKAAFVKTGLDSIDLAIDLHFTSASGEVAPALRNPPEFEVLPASIFWNREEDKAPENHWFFKDLSRGKTYYSDDDVKEIRHTISSKQEILGLDHVFVFLNLGEKPKICAIPSSMESMRSYLERAMNGLKDSSTKDDIPASKRAEYERDTRGLLKATFEAIFGTVTDPKYYFIIFMFVFCRKCGNGDT